MATKNRAELPKLITCVILALFVAVFIVQPCSAALQNVHAACCGHTQSCHKPVSSGCAMQSVAFVRPEVPASTAAPLVMMFPVPAVTAVLSMQARTAPAPALFDGGARYLHNSVLLI